MLKISTKGRYALEAILYMEVSSAGGSVSISQIAESTRISIRYLEQIFFTLRKSGILDTVRGPKGGYRVNKPAAELTVGEVVRAVEGTLAPVPCVGDAAMCTSKAKEQCATRELWVNISGAIDEVLDTVTFEDLRSYYHKQYGTWQGAFI